MARGITCSHCGYEQTEVVDSRPGRESIRRRRRCPKCGHRFTTVEKIIPAQANFNYVRMRALRDSGLTLMQTAERMGVSYSTIWKRENDY